MEGLSFTTQLPPPSALGLLSPSLDSFNLFSSPDTPLIATAPKNARDASALYAAQCQLMLAAPDVQQLRRKGMNNNHGVRTCFSTQRG